MNNDDISLGIVLFLFNVIHINPFLPRITPLLFYLRGCGIFVAFLPPLGVFRDEFGVNLSSMKDLFCHLVSTFSTSSPSLLPEMHLFQTHPRPLPTGLRYSYLCLSLNYMNLLKPCFNCWLLNLKITKNSLKNWQINTTFIFITVL